jgi:hypothetical protein
MSLGGEALSFTTDPVRNIGSIAQLVIPEWVTVLHLADKWALGDLREYAIAHLEPLFADQNGAWQLKIAQDHDVAQWLYPGVERLVLRRASLSVADISMLDADTLALVSSFRDQNIASMVSASSRSSERYLMNAQIANAIKSTFKSDS